MVKFNNMQKMSEEEIVSLIHEFIKDIERKPGFGEVIIGIRNSKVCTIKPSPIYNIGENKKN